MLLTRQPDGSLLIEGRADHFSQLWKAAPVASRVVLPDGRPAVREVKMEGVTYTTIHGRAWEVLRVLPRNRAILHSRTKLCEFCSTELKVSKEYETVWCFTCPVCKSVETHSKQMIGGTLGAGTKEKR